MVYSIISVKMILNLDFINLNFDFNFGGAYLLRGGKTLPYRALTEQIRLEILKQCYVTQEWHYAFVIPS